MKGRLPGMKSTFTAPPPPPHPTHADRSLIYCCRSYFFFTKITVQGSDLHSAPAMVIFPDVQAAKSIIHIINKVVLPEL